MAGKPKAKDAVGTNRQELIKQIEAAMAEKNWSVADLLAKSGISPQTYDRLFDESKPFTGMRSDAVLRLCRAFGCSSETSRLWLAWAGQSDFSTANIDKFLGQQTSQPHDETPPTFMAASEYLGRVSNELKTGSHVLMCTCVVSKPAPIDDEQLKTNLLNALHQGLHTVVVCPYPAGDAKYYDAVPNLAAFYDQVLAWTKVLVSTLRQSLDDSHKLQVQGFRLRSEPNASRLNLIPPVLQRGAPRPNLVKFVKDGNERYELGSYRRWERQWQIVHPYRGDNPNEQIETIEICNIWKDYFREISEKWRPTDKAEPFSQKAADWKSWELI